MLLNHSKNQEKRSLLHFIGEIMRTKLEERSLVLGVGVIEYLRQNNEVLTKKNREQLVSSGTSVGANLAEARSAQSRADFISKLEIALKEARETDYWLTILYKTSKNPDVSLRYLLKECDEITAMLVASVKTAKANAVKAQLGIEMI